MKRQLSIVRAVARQASKAKVTPTATLRCFSAINKRGFTVNNAAFTRSLSAARFSPTITRQYSTEELEIKVPGMGDAISEGTIVAWLKEIGSPVAQDDVIVQIETDKVTVDIRAPVSGKLSAQLAEAGATVRVGQDLAKIIPGAVEIPKPSAEKPKAEKQTPAPAAEQPKPAKTEAAAPQTPAKPAEPQAAPATESSQRVERRVPMSRMRQRIAQRLKDSQNTAAMLTTFNEIDMSQLMELRSSLKDEFEKKHKVKLGFMSAFVKASALALVNQPIVNAVIDGTDIVYRDYVDISVAVASPTGLVVPVLRDCQNMGFADVEKAIGSYGAKAKDGTLTIEEMQGGTFTISNGGVFGSMMGTPIINPPQSAILGMHGVQKRAVVVNDQVVVRPVMYVALTYDHRIIDGREAVTFLKKIKEYIEDPRKMLLEL